MQILPVILCEGIVCVICPGLDPDDFISLVDLGRVDTFFAQGNLVLLVVVDGRHLLDYAEEDGDGVFGESGASVSEMC